MKNKKIKIISISIVFLIIIFCGLSYIISPTAKIVLNDAFGWFSFLSTLVTLVIALLLFEKYGLEKKIVNREQEVVFELIDLLSRKILVVHKIRQTSADYFSYNLFSEGKNNDIHRTGLDLYFCEKSVIGFNVLKEYENNFWLPNLIKDKLQKANDYTMIFNDEEVDSCIRISLLNQIDSESEAGLKYGKYYPQITLEEYLNRWTDLRKTIIFWIEENSDGYRYK